MQDSGLFVAMLEQGTTASLLNGDLGMYKGEAVLIEVKARNGNTKSTNTVLKNKEQYGVNLCIKFEECNVGLEGEKLSLPYYMAFLLDK